MLTLAKPLPAQKPFRSRSVPLAKPLEEKERKQPNISRVLVWDVGLSLGRDAIARANASLPLVLRATQPTMLPTLRG
jgi:hypothetical protein